MSDINIIENHSLIREIIGYEAISKIDLFDLPNVMRFLNVVYNYKKMLCISQKE